MKYLKYLFIIVLAFCLFACGKKEPTEKVETKDPTIVETTPVEPRPVEPTPVTTYTVSFIDENGNELSTQTVEAGKDAVAPVAPEKEGYRFVEWNKDFTNVQSNLIVLPVYEKDTVIVKFVDELGAEIDSFEVNIGESVEPIDGPQKLGYEFVGWDAELTNVTQSMEVRPLYEINTYSISYYDGTKLLNLAPSTYTVLDYIDLPMIEKEGFEFIGWFEDSNPNTKVGTFNSETGDKVYRAKWESLEVADQLVMPSDMTFTVSTIKKVPHSSGNGTYVYQPDLTTASITLPSTSVTKWTWSSLDDGIAKISQWSSISVVSNGYCILKMVYNDDPSIIGYIVIHCGADGVEGSTIEQANKVETFTVTFKDGDNVIGTCEVKSGSAAAVPTVPTHDGKTFIGWDKDIYNIKADTTLTAQYIDGKSYFENKTVSILGDSISTYKGIIPDGYSYFYPYPTADLGDPNQTWWMYTINKLGMKLLKNNSWSGSCVSSGTGQSSCTLDTRLQELVDGDKKPDIIIIMMGANDCGSRYVAFETFDSSYKIMLDKIKALCPDAEIFLSTIPTISMASAEDRKLYNDCIEKYAKEYGLNMIHVDEAFSNPSDYLVDSAHPNKTGMDLMGETCVYYLLKSIDVEYTKVN